MKHKKPTEGFEPPTRGLQNRCSTPELRRHNIVEVLYDKGLFTVVY
jgi:hypothetical protein